MSTNHHTPWQDTVTTYRSSHMNVPLGELDNVLGGVSGELESTKHTAHPYDIGASYGGKTSSGEFLIRFPFTRTIVYGVDMPGSYAKADIVATSSTVFKMQKEGTQFGTITFGVGSKTGTFSGEAKTFSAGEVFVITCPETPDATLAEIGLSIAGTRE